MAQLTSGQLARMIDHTQLKAFATEQDFRTLCDEAKRYHFAMVAINPAPVRLCKQLLEGTDVHVGAAIAFPLGQLTIREKANETREALLDGADEIDYVVNLTQLKEKRYAYLEEEMRAVIELCREGRAISKVIFETCYLTDDEKKALCDIALKVLPDFIKTSTGFGTGGATEADVKLMKDRVGGAVRVKASGGVRTLEAALALVQLGAERIGTSAGVALVDALRAAE